MRRSSRAQRWTCPRPPAQARRDPANPGDSEECRVMLAPDVAGRARQVSFVADAASDSGLMEGSWVGLTLEESRATALAFLLKVETLGLYER